MKRLSLVLGAVGLLVAFRAGATAPAILSEPQSVTNNNASAAAFAVVATNAATYQWYFQGASSLPGATNATLSLDDLSSNQAGSYTVVVTSSDNISVTSTPPAVLTIVPGTLIRWTISTYPGGGSSNFVVQLFDHDKPATVENFLHYITSGTYANMFFDRDATNFVLQGGDDVSSDRTTNGLDFSAISPGTNFPSQVENEFGVGPLIHNQFGTLAMALTSESTNSATSAFFFNLVDNSTNLDIQDFTVFGRILYGTNAGSNVLQYFNTLSAPSNGIYDDVFDNVPTLPVNYDGTNSPNNANLFYCDFQFLSSPPVDTTPPTVSITSPAPNAVFTNGVDVAYTGTASDNVAVAEVFYTVSSLAGIYDGQSYTNAALGATDWSLDIGTIAPGIYQVTAYAQDGAGNLSAPATEYFTNLAILTIITNTGGELGTNMQYLVPGEQYSETAEPGTGERFVNWQIQGVVSLDPVQTFTAETNMTIEVTYISTNLPPGLAITSPAAGSVAQTTNDGLTISGTIPSSITVTQLTVQLFAQSNAVTAALPASQNGTNWSLAESGLAGGPYTVVVVAEDSLGQEGFASENFTALVAPPIILSEPQSVTNNTGSSADFSVTASNAVIYQWQLTGSGPIAGATTAALALNDISSNQSGSSYFVVVTAQDGETVTSTPAKLTVVPGTLVQLTISKYPGGGSNIVALELFNHDKPATVENFIHYITSGAYANTFFDTDDTNFVLQGGDYVTLDRTTNDLAIEPVSTGTNVFPSQIDSEFNVGPLVPNTYGTLAAIGSGSPGFFFNLGDNSTNLDNAGYTVFGRILSGSNVLQYFNTLSAPSNGLFENTNYNLPGPLPVNYDGANYPKNDNVFYCDFKFQTPPPLDTNPPMVAITFPAPNAVFTNGSPLTITGTASDNVGLAGVFCVLTSSTGAYGDAGQTNAAQGATNWSLDLGAIEPGVYQLQALAQDGAGNLSAPATQYFTNLATITIMTNVDGRQTTAAPQYLVPGQPFSVTAAPETGEHFYSWTSNGVASLNPVQKFTVNGNVTLTATYLPTNASTGLTITSPHSGAQALSIQNVLTVSGTIASTSLTQLTCQFFHNSNSVSTALPAAIAGTNWSVTVSNLANGSNYMVEALATNAGGQDALASATFTLLNVDILTLKTNGGGSIVNTNFKPSAPYVVPGTHIVKAAPAKGYVFYSWNDGTTTTLNPTDTFQIVSNLTLTATFLPEDTALTGLTITYPAANAMLTNGTFSVDGKLPASLDITQVKYQLFLQSNAVTALQPATIDATGAKWSFPVTNLNAGPYTILAVGYDNKGNSRLVSENFNLLARLAVSVQGQGAVTAGLNGKYLQVGKSYTIAATPKKGQVFAYWTGAVESPSNATTAFVMSSNTVLTAYFATNLFPSVAGAYTGLFFNPASVAPTNAGFVKVTVTSTGAVSGDVMFPSITYPISYSFSYNGGINLSAPDAFDSNTLDLVLNLDLTNGTDSITGYLADQTSSGTYIWASELVLYRAVTTLSGSNAPAAGKYVLLLQPQNATNGPVAAGYASVSLVTSGALALGGVLPDNSAISQSAKMSQDGIWPVYIVPSSYKNKGMVIGWQTNTHAGVSEGRLFWRQPGAAFATNLTSTGAVLAAPLANTSYQMVLPGGTTYPLPVNAAGKFISQSPIVGLSLLSTGALSGDLEVNQEKLAFKGAFVNPTEGGAGFIIDTNGQKEGFLIYGNN